MSSTPNGSFAREVHERFETIRASLLPQNRSKARRLWLEAVLMGVLATSAVTVAFRMPSEVVPQVAQATSAPQEPLLSAVELRVAHIAPLVSRSDVPTEPVPDLTAAETNPAASRKEPVDARQHQPAMDPAPAATYAVQVAAPDNRAEADVVAGRLTSKGYDTFVQMAPTSNGEVFRVRVGTFGTRLEAEAAAARLRTEERFDPLVLRTTVDTQQPK